MSRKILFLLFTITLFAGCIRFYQISKVPVSLYWDEVASTYNAYSILQTGKDEYGTQFPLLFRSFNDYKASGNIYLTTIPVVIFGLNEFSARFTSAFFGTLSVSVLFFLLRELFLYTKSEIRLKKYSLRINKDSIGLFSAGLLAISPWHIQFSRTGFEANVALFFLLLGVWLFLLGLRKSFYCFFLAMIIFAWNFYVYRSIFVVEPLILIVLFMNFYKELFKHLGFIKLFLGIILFILVLLPFLPAIFSVGGMARAKQVNVFTNSQEKLNTVSQNRFNDNSLTGRILYNQKLAYPKILIQNYFSHFNPNFLFFHGDANGRHGARGMGLLYLWEIPFFLLGIAGTFLLHKKVKRIIFSWMLIAPIPAVLSVSAPHALRSLNGAPVLAFFTAFGIYIMLQLLKSGKKHVAFCWLLSIIIIVFFIRYLYQYYVVTAKATSADWADGYKQLTQYVFAHQQNYQKVLISGHYWQPYIYFLFYSKYPPVLYQKYGSKKGFDKYVFGGTSWDKQQYSQELGGVNLKQFARADHLLVVLSPDEYNRQKGNIHKLTEIRNHNNEVVFIAGETL